MKYEPHGCPIRYGLGLFGDRWSLLIIRDLMFLGRRSYGDFLSAGEGISTNILADRLAQLEVGGIVTKSHDPEHGKKFIYRLTEKGLDLMPVLFAIIDWSEKYDEQTAVPKKFIENVRKRPKMLRRKFLKALDR
jgi:DNA-binding HxlR family transcriptional regulator